VVTSKKNLLGIGNAAMGGFLAGYLKGMDHMESAELATLLAGAKIEDKENLPYLDNPQAALDKAFLRSSLGGLKSAYNNAGDPRVRAASRA